MCDKNPVYVQVVIIWTQTKQAMFGWLNSAHVLPLGITDKELTDLILECENARKRLRETNRG